MSIRPILWQDVLVLAGCLTDQPGAEVGPRVRKVLARASAGDAYRKRFRRAHPEYGSGILVDAIPKEWRRRDAVQLAPGEAPVAACLAGIFRELAAWRQSGQVCGGGALAAGHGDGAHENTDHGDGRQG